MTKFFFEKNHLFLITNIIKGGYNLSFLYDTYMIHIEYCNFRACF